MEWDGERTYDPFITERARRIALALQAALQAHGHAWAIPDELE